MATIRAYTTIEQSKKLIELGVDINTADIIYTTFYGKVDKDLPIPKEVYDMIKSPINRDKIIFAWSLTALLEYAKYAYKEGYIAIESCVGDDERWQVAIYSYEEGSVKAFEELKLIDAAFQMVCWLKKEKYI